MWGRAPLPCGIHRSLRWEFKPFNDHDASHVRQLSRPRHPPKSRPAAIHIWCSPPRAPTTGRCTKSSPTTESPTHHQPTGIVSRAPGPGRHWFPARSWRASPGSRRRPSPAWTRSAAGDVVPPGPARPDPDAFTEEGSSRRASTRSGPIDVATTPAYGLPSGRRCGHELHRLDQGRPDRRGLDRRGSHPVL